MRMHVPDLLQSRVAECEAMAKNAREPDSRAAWERMALRWRRCAELEVKADQSAAQKASERHRKAPPGWSRH
jgi:hypothetical protein